jgi:hypothetical protein
MKAADIGLGAYLSTILTLLRELNATSHDHDKGPVVGRPFKPTGALVRSAVLLWSVRLYHTVCIDETYTTPLYL